MSSILISGMEMPKEGTVIAIYKLNGKFYASVHGTELCQLCPVPPHGDLIDRDALIVDLWHEIQQAVANAPAIIPAEEGET